MGQRLLYRIDPIAAAEADDAKLARQEERAQSKLELHIGRAIDGLHRVHGYLTTEAMAAFTAVLDVLAAPPGR